MHKKILCLFVIVAACIAAAHTAYADTPSLLKDLDVTNGYMMQFMQDTYRYTVELDEGETTANIMAIPADDKCSVLITGNENKVSLGAPKTVLVSVNDTQGNFVTYTLDVYAYGEKGGLSFLDCENGIMYPQYRDTIRNYYITLPYDCNSAELNIRTRDSDDKVAVDGNENIEPGKRKRVLLTVENGEGKKTQYVIYVYRQRQIQSNIDLDFLLSSIEINNGAVKIDFERTRGYYKIEVPRGIDEVDVKALAENGRNIVNVIGNNVISDENNNIVIVTVNSPDDSEAEQSVYVLDFVRDSFVATPQYTGMQMLAVIIASVFFTGLLAFLLIYLYKTRNKDAENSFVLADPETEVVEEREMVLKG